MAAYTTYIMPKIEPKTPESPVVFPPKNAVLFKVERQCACGEEAARFVCKNGNNAGKAFFKCHYQGSQFNQKQREEFQEKGTTCNFWEWEDDEKNKELQAKREAGRAKAGARRDGIESRVTKLEEQIAHILATMNAPPNMAEGSSLVP